MQTRWTQARRVHAGDKIVTGGELNPLGQGGRRRAWDVCEARTRPSTAIATVGPDGQPGTPGGAVCEFRMVIRGGAADGADAWLTTPVLDPAMKVRVLAAA